MRPAAKPTPPGHEIERRAKTELEQLDKWRHATAGERKLWASRAARDRDEGELWDLLRASLSRSSASVHTLRSYRTGLRALLASFESVNLLRATPADAERFRYDLERENEIGRKLSASSVRQRMSVAAAFYAALRWAGATDVDPFGSAARPKPPDRAADRMRGKAVREEELEALLLHVRQRKPVDPDALLLEVVLLLGAHAGLRASEMLALHWTEVDVAGHEVRVKSGKGNRARTVVMSRALRAALVERRGVAGSGAPDGQVVPIGSPRALYGRLARLWAASIGKWPQDRGPRPFVGVGVHGLRHYAGVRLAAEAQDLRVVRDHLGHASVQTTEGYAASASARFVRDW